MIMVAIAMMTITTGAFAQGREKSDQLTDAQKEQMKEVKEKYAPTIKELRSELHIATTQQKVLLSSQEIDEKAIYANIDKMGELKADMQKQTLAMRTEMKDICPEACKGQHGNKARAQKGNNSKEGKGGHARAAKEGKKEGMSKRPQHGEQLAKCDAKGGSQKCQKGGAEKGQKGQDCKLKLNTEQTDQIAEIKKAHFWKIQEIENEITLAKAKGNKEDAKMIAEINALQTELAKERMAVKLETIKILTEEQRMQMIAMKSEKGRGHGKQRQHQQRM